MAAYEYIRTAIVEGDFEPGQRLTEEYLAAKFHMSRTPIREAMRQLEAEGLLMTQGRGMAVKEFTVDEIKEIYDLRALLEGHAAERAAIRATTDQVEELHRINQAMSTVVAPTKKVLSKDEVGQIMQVNQHIHATIMRLGQNGYLAQFVEKTMVLPLIFRSFYWRTGEEIIRSLDDHAVIISAIASQDPHRARAAMAEHIFVGRDQVLKNLSRSTHI